MDNSTYVSLSGLTALDRGIAVTANNLANANTAGFKGERSVFEAYVARQGSDPKGDVSFVLDKGSYVDTTAGGMEMTHSPFDLAIQGDGWFGYQTTDGQIGLGRNGQLTRNAAGQVVTATGHQVLDDGGAPLAVPPDTDAITISRDGTISSAEGDVIGRVGVFRGADIQSYIRVAGGVFLPPGGAPPDLEPMNGAQVVQGAVERSNVDPISEMTRMIEAQRAFERGINAMNNEDKLLKETLTRLGRSA